MNPDRRNLTFGNIEHTSSLHRPLDIAYTPMHTWPMTATAQITGHDIVDEQTHRGATIQTQRNGYFAVIRRGTRYGQIVNVRQGGFVSVEEARQFIHTGS